MLQNELPEIEETARAWADITIERWQKKLKTLNIGYTRDLERSIELEALSFANSGGTIEFLFLYYGKFTDMGVGRGTAIGDVAGLRRDRYLSGRQRGNYRRPRRWYTDVFFKEVTKLKYILSENYGMQAVNAIVEAIDDNSQVE
jgi:hypothetical protein